MTLPTLTPSSINDLMDCAKKYHTLRVLKEWPPRDGVHLGIEFGIGFHAIIRQVYDPRRKPLPHLDDLPVWARKAFYARRYPDAETRECEMERCLQAVYAYVAQDEDAEATFDVEVEGSLTVEHAGQPLFDLYARLDRVLVRPNEPEHLIVRDYKCAARHVNLLEAYVLLRVAKLLYPTYQHYSVEFDWIADGTVERDIIAGSELKGLDPIVKARALEVFTASEYPAQPGDGCLGCPLRRECREQPPVELSAVFGDQI